MIRVDVAQGSREWLRARAGIPSASNAHRIVTPAKGAPSSAMHGYACELLAEQALGRPLDDATTGYMQRGTQLETEARAWYALQRDTDVEQVGFLLRDDRQFGCSPDALVGDDGGLEIKCPSADKHLSYMLGEAESLYRCQIQSALWVTGREWWDFVSFHPELPPVLIRFQRDEEFIAKLAEGVGVLSGMLLTFKAQIAARGFVFPDPAPLEPHPLSVGLDDIGWAELEAEEAAADFERATLAAGGA